MQAGQGLVCGRCGKRMPRFGKPILTNDAAGSMEALGQSLGCCKGATSARTCFGAIRKKNDKIRKTNSNKQRRWVNGSTWAADGLLQGSAINEGLFVGDSEKECQDLDKGQPKHLGSTWALARERHQRGLACGRFGTRMPRFGKRILTSDAPGSMEALGQHLGS